MDKSPSVLIIKMSLLVRRADFRGLLHGQKSKCSDYQGVTGILRVPNFRGLNVYTLL